MMRKNHIQFSANISDPTPEKKIGKIADNSESPSSNEDSSIVFTHVLGPMNDCRAANAKLRAFMRANGGGDMAEAGNSSQANDHPSHGFENAYR